MGIRYIFRYKGINWYKVYIGNNNFDFLRYKLETVTLIQKKGEVNKVTFRNSQMRKKRIKADVLPISFSIMTVAYSPCVSLVSILNFHVKSAP